MTRPLVVVAVVATLGTFIPPAAAEEVVEVVGHGQSEVAYAAGVRDRLMRTVHFPTGREASLTQPEGTATVWFVLARDGRVVARGLEASSNSMLLDGQAQQLVGRGRYGALPATAWAGESTHRFVATYRFVHRDAGTTDADHAQVALR